MTLRQQPCFYEWTLLLLSLDTKVSLEKQLIISGFGETVASLWGTEFTVMISFMRVTLNSPRMSRLLIDA